MYNILNKLKIVFSLRYCNWKYATNEIKIIIYSKTIDDAMNHDELGVEEANKYSFVASNN